MSLTRKIIHIDMDAFYASVEQRNRPELKSKPVIVGGAPGSRGVVAACSYEARKFGIHSAMPSSKAYRLCPHAIFLRPRFDLYRSVSVDIKKIFYQYTDLVEPLSLDEAFLDVTKNKKQIVSATAVAKEILAKIHRTTGGLTASAGVSFNKFLAKVASDFNKPHGITVITPENAAVFIDTLPVRKFFGVGRVTEEKMHRLGIKTGADLKQLGPEKLINHFGKAGRYFYDMACGKDDRPVETQWIRKSIGKETTFQEDIDDQDYMLEVLARLAAAIEKRLQTGDCKGMTVTLKVKYFDFKSITRSVTVHQPVADADTIMKHVRSLLDHTAAGTKKVRLLGISISNFIDSSGRIQKQIQLPLPLKLAQTLPEQCQQNRQSF